MARLALDLLIPVAQGGSSDSGSGIGTTVLVIVGLGVLVTLGVVWVRTRQRRYWQGASFSEDDDPQLLTQTESDADYEAGPLRPHLYIKGLNGQIEVNNEWVRIHRKGFFGRTTQGLSGLRVRGVQIRLGDVDEIDII